MVIEKRGMVFPITNCMGYFYPMFLLLYRKERPWHFIVISNSDLHFCIPFKKMAEKSRHVISWKILSLVRFKNILS